MTRNTLLRDAINTALYGGAALALVAAPNAFAQDDAGAEQLETITVVGSRIKRTDIETSQPVFVIEREDLQKTGLTSVGDILQDLTSNGAALNTTVLPFILRGVSLLGINANSPMPLREAVWRKIAGDYRPAHLHAIANVIGLEELPAWLDRTLDGQARGRTVIDMRR